MWAGLHVNADDRQKAITKAYPEHGFGKLKVLKQIARYFCRSVTINL